MSALDQVATARAIATQAHAGQTDKVGRPYIDHPQRVADRLGGSQEQAVAWLHDVLEDTEVGAAQLLDAGIDPEVVDAVVLLTRTGGLPGGTYYSRIAASPLARAVKLADIADNTDPARAALLDPKDRLRLARKYSKARRALGAQKEIHMSTEMKDRAAGVMLGMAAGDALGAPYEFGAPMPDGAEVRMRAGRGWELGEWTDDTSMAIPLLEVAARGERFEGDALEHVITRWLDWARHPKDIGIQTSQVLRTASPVGTAEAALNASRAFAASHEKSAGNGSLMRTAPVALAYLDDEAGLIEAARLVSDLTHADPLAGDACVLWSLAIRHAVLTAELDLRSGLAAIPEERRDGWRARIDEAEAKQPRDFAGSNGWAGAALQGAWSAITHGDGIVDVLERAVRGGHDTDTVAAIAGALIGAVHGGSAVPARWRRLLHGWPRLDADELVRMAVLAAGKGESDRDGWPAAERFVPTHRTCVQHPHDDGVWLGSLKALDDLPEEIDAVVSLCRAGTKQTDREQVEFWLIDKPDSNPNLDFILRDAADTVAALRAEGKTVFLHCFEGRSRTPAVGATYSVLHLGKPADVALREVIDALPEGNPQRFFRDAVRRIAGAA